MGLLQQLEQAVTGNDGTGQDSGPLVPGVHNPFQSGSTTWLPGAGNLNPFNPNSAAGQTFAGVGELNIWNPDSAVGKAANDVAKNLGATIQAIAQDPKKLAAVALVIAYPGAAAAVAEFLLPAEFVAAYPAAATIMGQTAINTATNGGDVKAAVTSAAIQYGVPKVADWVAKSYASESVSRAFTDWAAKATVDVGIAAAMGKDPAAALLFSGAKAATSAVLEYTGLDDRLKNLPDVAASAVRDAITAKMMNSDPSKAVAQNLVNYAISSAQTMYAAQKKAVQWDVLPFTAQQLTHIPAWAGEDGISNIVMAQGAAEDGRFELQDDEFVELARMITVLPPGTDLFNYGEGNVIQDDEALRNFFQQKEIEFRATQAPTSEELDGLARNKGWTDAAQQREALAAGYTDSSSYWDDFYTKQALAEGWATRSEKYAALKVGFTNVGEYNLAKIFGYDTKAELTDYQDKSALFKDITGREATPADIKQFVVNIPTTEDAQIAFRQAQGALYYPKTAGKSYFFTPDIKYDYNGDGVVDMTDARALSDAVYNAANGLPVAPPSPNSFWGQKTSNEEFKQQITDAKIESDRLAKIESDRLAKIESDRLAKIESDEIERLEKIESDRLAKIESDRLAKIESDKLAKIESDKLAKIESDKLAKIESDKLAKIESDEIERLRLAGLQENTNVDLTKVVGGTDTTTGGTGVDTVAVDGTGGAGTNLDQNTVAVDESVITGGAGTDTVIDDLTNAGLHDDFDNTDLTEVVEGTDTTTDDTGTDTTTDDTGTDTTTDDTGTDTTTDDTGTDTTTDDTGTDTTTDDTGTDTTTDDTGTDTVEGGDDATGGAGTNVDQDTEDTEVTGDDATGGAGTNVDQDTEETEVTGDDDDTVEGGGDEVDTTCADGFHWDEGRQMCMPDDDEVDTTCADGFHWDEGRQMCMPDDDADGEEESTDCPAGYLYNLNTKSCDPIGGGLSIRPIKLPKTPTTPTTPKTPTTTPKTPTAPTTTAPNQNNMALFALLASLGEPAATPAPVVDNAPSEPFDFTSEFEVNPFAKKQSASKMAQGGSIDELLDILRRN